MIDLSLIDITLYFVLIYILLDSLNIVRKFKDYKKNGILYLYPIDTVFIQYKFLSSKAVNYLLSYNVFKSIICFRLTVSILIFSNVCPFSSVIILLFIQIFLHIRNESLFNLADKYVINILLALSFFYISKNSQIIQHSSIFFIAILSIIAYFFTAFFKIKGETWRNGVALEQILSTDLYGNERYYKFLKKNVFFSRLLNYSVILIQLSAPLTILSSKYAIIYFILGFVFHLSISILMNLNNFFWVFISTYPCIYFVSLKVENYLWS